MLQTHYVKTRPRSSEKSLNDVLSSLVYSVIPGDILLTKQSILDKVYTYYNQHPDECRGLTKRNTDISRAVENLTKNGFLKELHGIRISRWLDTF